MKSIGSQIGTAYRRCMSPKREIDTFAGTFLRLRGAVPQELDLEVLLEGQNSDKGEIMLEDPLSELIDEVTCERHFSGSTSRPD